MSPEKKEREEKQGQEESGGRKERVWEVESEVKKVLLVRRNGSAAFSGPIG
jgi:hypothetical protein